MTLPGTHDSGTYKPKCFLGRLWIKTQNLPIVQQLRLGVRVLDLRIGQISPGNYEIVHDKWRTSYTLAAALKEVTDFIDNDATGKEIVILDFHLFVKLDEGTDYDFVQLKTQIQSQLNGYLLSAENGHGKLLQQIWQACGKGRVVVAWNRNNPDSYMWPGVHQHWYKDADSKIKLYEAIKDDMLNPRHNRSLWTACSFMESSEFHPPDRNASASDPTIKQWYFGGSTFCKNANIISVDFFREHTNVVQASIIGSLLKAGAK